MEKYQVLMHGKAFTKVRDYLEKLENEEVSAGAYLYRSLQGKQVSKLSTEEFIELLVGTKRPQIFAESAVFGDGTDWDREELSILGDIAVAVPVTVFDNGMHYRPMVHAEPFPATLVFTPGALLRNGRSLPPADWEEVVTDDKIDPEAYRRLYERRLLPLFIYADEIAESNGKKAFITVPGLGCGQFAGEFKGRLGHEL